jgi:hypothetical protein
MKSPDNGQDRGKRARVRQSLPAQPASPAVPVHAFTTDGLGEYLEEYKQLPNPRFCKFSVAVFFQKKKKS